MRKIARHPKYLQKRSELAQQHPGLLTYLDRLEQVIADDPSWPISVHVPAYDCWWSHLLVDDDSIPHMRVFHAFDDQEVRFLTIVPFE